jgi:hypothetical protein
MSKSVISAATEAVFGLQYNTNKAVRFVCTETGASAEAAAKAVDSVARPSAAAKRGIKSK